ncbi:FAD/NAD(P)-binding protein [Vreelandella titanicae]|uniref:FAD/NAD(P)-binding protein n=1 Tax=Vreelandella titanicae TaxID=664683 RepID=UPI0039BFF1FE
MQQRKQVVIIGGGSVGGSAFHQLIQHAAKMGVSDYLEITLIERSSKVGSGEAYQNDHSHALLNTHADTMSPIAGQSSHFINWLYQNEELWRQQYPHLYVHPSAYLPRPLFGLYMQNLFDDSRTLAWQYRIPFTRLHCEASDIVPTEEGYLVITDNDKRIKADYLLLCCGNLPSTKFKAHHQRSSYFNSPYPGCVLAEQIDKDQPVCIAGTNLSAIDTIISLTEHGHRGKIICVSRRGRFPSVRGTQNPKHKPRYITASAITALSKAHDGITLEDVWHLLNQELLAVGGREIDIQEILSEGTTAYDYLCQEISKATQVPRLWQSIAYSLNSVIDMIWHHLRKEDKRKFYCEYRDLFLAYRVSFPLENARRLQKLMETGQLNIHSGIQRVGYDEAENCYNIELIDNAWNHEMRVRSRYFINATGYNLSVGESEVALIQNLLKRKLATADPFGGFRTDFKTGALLSSSGLPQRHLFALGSLTTGTYFFTNAMDVNARHISERAGHIVEQIAIEALSQTRDAV